MNKLSLLALSALIFVACVPNVEQNMQERPSEPTSQKMQDSPKDEGKMMRNDEMMEDGMMMEDEESNEEGAELMHDDDSMMNDDSMMQASVGKYVEYEEGVIGNGEEAVLFFHAKWCPDCRANDGRLQEWYPSNDFVPVYKIDYDTAAELKKRYGVVQQDTFVRIDSSGNAVESVSFPTEQRLMSIIEQS